MAEKHLYEQKEFTQSYLIPYFEKHIHEFKEFRILEIGCAEGGFLDILHHMGIQVVGLELQAERVKTARNSNPELEIYVGDITDKKISEKIKGKFDLIIMRDTIEHIPDRSATFDNINKLLRNEGYLYITFPPRFSGFAGHQQNGRTFLKRIPYLHLLPNAILRNLGKILNEKPGLVDAVISNYQHGLTIRQFEKYVQAYNFHPVVRELFLFRPVYKIRFKIKPRKFPNIYFLREFFAFGCEYLLKNHKS
jgi:SAM-dependent methyltransferase